MIRTQISLTKVQYDRLSARSQKTGESIASIIRRSLELLERVEAEAVKNAATSR